MQTRLVEQLSSREYEAYVASILKQIERQDAEALREVLRLLRETRLYIAQELVTAKGWQTSGSARHHHRPGKRFLPRSRAY